jgi:poly(3-hydroxybutyrate) depolymerase
MTLHYGTKFQDMPAPAVAIGHWVRPRGHGEALSIREMVEHAIATFTTDRRKVFVTGLSAGGAMALLCLQHIRRFLPAAPFVGSAFARPDYGYGYGYPAYRYGIKLKTV